MGRFFLLLVQGYFFWSGMSSDIILAESNAKGIPPPGCTDPPQKYKFFSWVEKLGWRKNAANLVLELLPYKAPCAEEVLDSIVLGSKICSNSINCSISACKSRLSFSRISFLALAISWSQSWPWLLGTFIIVNQFIEPSGASSGLHTEVQLMYTVGSS